jgi:hypothetical protein
MITNLAKIYNRNKIIREFLEHISKNVNRKILVLSSRVGEFDQFKEIESENI